MEELKPVQPIRNAPQPVAQVVLTLLTNGHVHIQGPDFNTKQGKAVTVEILSKAMSHIAMLETKEHNIVLAGPGSNGRINA